MLIQRPFWLQKIEEAWNERNVIWLMGISRSGKTSLCRSIPNIIYYDCEQPRIRLLFQDPESFLESHRGKTIALDEIHRLDNPSELLKIAADYFKDIKIIATGSSRFMFNNKCKDTLTGRKREIWLTPLLLQEMEIFGCADLEHYFLFGGLPENFMNDSLPEKDFQEWLDYYGIKGIENIAKIAKKAAFQKFIEYIFSHSGETFEISACAQACEVSRPTILSYLDVLEATFVVHRIRPFSTHRSTEIVLAPKIYGFDTGFVCYAKGWREIKQEDLGFMWEHCVLNELHGRLQMRNINYWRDKRGQEIDFIIRTKANSSISTIECKYIITEKDMMPKSVIKNIETFRQFYPEGKNFIVASNIAKSFSRMHEGIEYSFVSLTDLINQLPK